MRTILDRLRTRLLPALLTAGGVALVAAGLLSYSDPAIAGSPGGTPTPSSAVASPTPLPRLSFVPTPSGSPGTSASPGATGIVSRVVVPALGIDLPIVKPPPNETFPYCDVAEYLTALHQPGQAGTTYIYAHARVGMFLPILTASKIDNGASMIGMLVQVFTNNDELHLYQITAVYRHQTDLHIAYAATTEQLMLQTSEGPRGTTGKVMVVATPIATVPADPAAANPTPHPLVCG